METSFVWQSQSQLVHFNELTNCRHLELTALTANKWPPPFALFPASAGRSSKAIEMHPVRRDVGSFSVKFTMTIEVARPSKQRHPKPDAMLGSLSLFTDVMWIGLSSQPKLIITTLYNEVLRFFAP